MQDILEQLINGPVDKDAPFIYSGKSHAQLRHQAMQLRDLLARNHKRTPICLCTEDRGHMAAALLAALSGGSTLILPYAFSKQALSETWRALRYDQALVNLRQPVPQNVTTIDLQRLPDSGARLDDVG